MDETSWKVSVVVPNKASYRHWNWVFVGADSVAYYLERSRGKDVAVGHLGLVPDEEGRLCLADGDELLLSSGLCTAYQSLGIEVSGLVNLWCWAHIRRYFIRCADAHQSCRAFGDSWIEAIRALYRSWHACVAAEGGSNEEATAPARCWEIVEEMDQRRKLQQDDATLPEPASKVLSTLAREWSNLVAFLDHPGVDLDNNCAERHLRGPVVLRKGCYGSRSLAQARLWAMPGPSSRPHRSAAGIPVVLEAYLSATAVAGGALTEGELKAFLPWSAPEERHVAFKRAPP